MKNDVVRLLDVLVCVLRWGWLLPRCVKQYMASHLYCIPKSCLGEVRGAVMLQVLRILQCSRISYLQLCERGMWRQTSIYTFIVPFFHLLRKSTARPIVRPKRISTSPLSQDAFGKKCVSLCVSMACDPRTPDLVFHGAVRSLVRIVLRVPTLHDTLASAMEEAQDSMDGHTMQRFFSVLALNTTAYMLHCMWAWFCATGGKQDVNYVKMR